MKLLEYNIGNGARAFSTMRGEGSGNYAGFNITDYCGDSAEHVTECRQALCKELGIEERSLILPRQTHSDRVACIDSHFMKMHSKERKHALHGADAVLTNLPHICIGVSTADCIPILMYDSSKHTVAAVHAGWRGTVAHIVEKSIAAMTVRYGCKPGDIQTVIGPGISLEAFEIGNEVYDAFCKAGFPMSKIAKRYPSDCDEKWHIDLWEANRIALLTSGVKNENIHTAGICTFANHKDFFSARRLGIESGRIFNGIMITG